MNKNTNRSASVQLQEDKIVSLVVTYLKRTLLRQGCPPNRFPDDLADQFRAFIYSIAKEDFREVEEGVENA